MRVGYTPIKSRCAAFEVHSYNIQVMPKAPRSRRWTFTLNNYQEVDESTLQSLVGPSMDITYLVYGREEAPQTGTQHLQGYLELSSKRTMKGLRRLTASLSNRPHLEIARGDQASNRVYCSKSGDYTELGTPNF